MALRRERDEIRNKLEDGVDEETRSDLERRLAVINQQIAHLKEALANNRTSVGLPVEEVIYVD